MIVWAENFLQCFRCFLRAVVRHPGEEMMRDMRVSDVMEHDVQNPIVTIHRRQCTPQPIPFLSGVVREGMICVLEEGDQDQPEVHDEVRNEVDLQQPGEARHLPDPVQSEQSHQDPCIAEEDEIPLLREEDRRGRHEVIDGEIEGGLPVVRTTGRIEEEIQRPAEEEHHDDVHCPEQRIQEIILRSIHAHTCWSTLRDEDLIRGEAACVRVVPSVADRPAEVRDEETGMENEPDRVVDPILLRETTVTALVTDDPETCPHTSLLSPRQRWKEE